MRIDCEIKQNRACKCIERCEYPRQQGATNTIEVKLSKTELRYIYTALRGELARKVSLFKNESDEVRERLEQEVNIYRTLAEKINKL